MIEEHLGKSKKSSRLNAKKEDKVELPIDKAWTPITIDLVIVEEQRLDDQPKVIRNVTLYNNESRELIGYHLTDYLLNQELIREQSSVSFYDVNKKTYVFGFTVHKNVQEITRNIPCRFINNGLLTLKVRKRRKLIVQSLLEEQRLKYDEQQDQSSKATKEKKIGEVVEKVALWRKFYTGFYDQFGNYIQKPLETAAQEVGIAKKTLDDYLLQIRNGKKYGFNFNQKVNAKIGELRAFVREQKKKQPVK